MASKSGLWFDAPHYADFQANRAGGLLARSVEESVGVGVSRDPSGFLEGERSLKDAVEACRLVNRAKALPAERENLSEAHAFRKIQKLSMDKSKKMTDIAEAVILLHWSSSASRCSGGQTMIGTRGCDRGLCYCCRQTGPEESGNAPVKAAR